MAEGSGGASGKGALSFFSKATWEMFGGISGGEVW